MTVIDQKMLLGVIEFLFSYNIKHIRNKAQHTHTHTRVNNQSSPRCLTYSGHVVCLCAGWGGVWRSSPGALPAVGVSVSPATHLNRSGPDEGVTGGWCFLTACMCVPLCAAALSLTLNSLSLISCVILWKDKEGHWRGAGGGEGGGVCGAMREPHP